MVMPLQTPGGTVRVVEGVEGVEGSKIPLVKVTVMDGETGLVEGNSVHTTIGCKCKNLYQVCTVCGA